jgi:hypothetical protein
VSVSKKTGCEMGGRDKKEPKHIYPTRDDAQRGLEWMVANMGVARDRVRVYECRYSDPGKPHFHVGRKPIAHRRNHGRRDNDRRKR